jgi:hypothetical protein
MNSLLLKAVVWICGLSWIGLLMWAGTVQLSPVLWAPFGTVVTIAGVIVSLFDKWLWRYWPFSLIAPRLDLRGTWRGEIASEWVDPNTNAAVAPIPTFMCITQTASELYLRQFTQESESATLAATIIKDADEAESITVVYRNDPRASVRHRSGIHYGGMRLRVTGKETLEGEYWTDRQTGGQLKLERVSRKKCRSFAEAKTFSK